MEQSSFEQLRGALTTRPPARARRFSHASKVTAPSSRLGPHQLERRAQTSIGRSLGHGRKQHGQCTVAVDGYCLPRWHPHHPGDDHGGAGVRARRAGLVAGARLPQHDCGECLYARSVRGGMGAGTLNDMKVKKE